MAVLTSKKVYWGARILLGFIFISAGTMKITDLESFSKVIEAFAIVPSGWCDFFAVMICAGEIISGVGLVADLKGSLGAVLSMLVAFIAVLSYAVFMGYDIDCGCFGPDDPEAVVFAGLKGSLVRDAAMVVQVLYLYLWRYKNNHFPLSFDFYKNRR